LDKQAEISALKKDYNEYKIKYTALRLELVEIKRISDDFEQKLLLDPKSKELREKYTMTKKLFKLKIKEANASYKIVRFKSGTVTKKKRDLAMLNYDFEIALATEKEKHTEKIQTKNHKIASMKFDLKSLERLPEDMVRVIGEFLPFEVLLLMREKQYGSLSSLLNRKIVYTYNWSMGDATTVKIVACYYHKIGLPAIKMFTRYKKDFPLFEQTTAEDFRRITFNDGGFYKLDLRMNLLYMMLKRQNPKLAYNMYNYFFLKIGDEKTVKPTK
jgi:hypothetical protein